LSKQVHNKKILKERRKSLRNNLTPAEILLWTFIGGEKLEGRKFRRQHSIDYYIVDFYCPAEQLVIELDGKHHFTEEGLKYDAERTKHLNSLKIRVIRFENDEVFQNVEAVLSVIKKHFKPPQSSPAG
jgi:very-short-patch-repair endonuclease